MINKYRIMLVKSERDNDESLFQYLKDTDNEDNELKVYETDDIEQLDLKVENMLNNEGYAKSDFIVVNVIEYGVKADIVNN